MILADKYSMYADEKLIGMQRDGNEEITDYLLEKYKNYVKKRARAMFLIGGDTDDLIQEGMIGLYKAIRDYDENKNVSFFTFAELCVNRQIYTAINASNRKKHGPLNSYISLYSADDAEGQSGNLLSDSTSEVATNPETLFINKENLYNLEKELRDSLSAMENTVLKFYIDGMSYTEIAGLMGKSPKSIDNAIQRIKSKCAELRK